MTAQKSQEHNGPLSPEENVGNVILSTIWTLDSLAILVVVLRMLTSCTVLRKVSLSDCLMLASLFFGLANCIAITISIHYGLGQHIMYLSADNISAALKWQVIAEPVGILCSMLGRISFCTYLLNLVGTRNWQKKVLHVCIWFGVFSNLLCIVLILMQCTNIQALYDRRIKAECWPISVQIYSGYFQGVSNTLIGLCLTLLPAYIVWKLRLSRNLKAGLYLVLCLSVLASIATIVKTIQLRSLEDSGDITYNLYPVIICYTLENVVVICVASAPCIWPLFLKRRNRVGHTNGVAGRHGDSQAQGRVGQDLRANIDSHGGITRKTVIIQATIESQDNKLDSS